MQQPVTTDPFTIMLINMTIVFAILYGLSWIIRLIQYIDPTRKKEEAVKPAPILQETTPDTKAADTLSVGVATLPAAGALATPSEMATAILPTAVPDAAIAGDIGDELEITAVIVAAVAAYGYSSDQFVSFRHAGEQAWTKVARIEGVNTRNQMG